jgi:hypothetical protein
MEVGCDTKHLTNKNAGKFLNDITWNYLELVTTINKPNEVNPEGSPVTSTQFMEFLHLSWRKIIQSAVPKFTGLVLEHPQTSGQIKDDLLMISTIQHHPSSTFSEIQASNKECTNGFLTPHDGL